MRKEMRNAAIFRANVVLLLVGVSMVYVIKKYTK